MKEQRRVFQKINKINEKTELSEIQKVELVGQYDFTKFKAQYDKDYSDYRTNYRKGINAAKSAADNHFKNLNDILRDAESTINEFGNKADELGIDYRSTKQFQQFQEIKKIILSAISSTREKQKEVSKIM